jgi:Cu/Ag efflux pump CusA
VAGLRGRRALLVAGLLAAPTLGRGLYPAFKERDFLMHWITPPGTSHAEERGS